MRAIALVAAVALAGCSSMQYSDNYDDVRSNPECVTQAPQPGEPVAPWCEPKQEVSWSSDRDGEPVDFRGDDD